MSTLGERIKLARGAFSQDVFSSQIEVNKGSLGFYERDENIPKADVVLRIVEKTGVSVEWLLTGCGNMRQSTPPQSQTAPQQPAFAGETRLCDRCVKLETELQEERQERRELSAELRTVNAENRQLARENGDLRVDVAVLRMQIETPAAKAEAADCA